MMLDLEHEYASPAMMKEYLQTVPMWERDAAAYREVASARAELDLPYGDRLRERLDVFAPESGAGGPVALFIHGGYWQAMDKSSFSHLARGANARGITVAIAGYTLCPEVTISEIVEEIGRAVAFVARRYGRPVTVFGHSAGGHLTACMLANLPAEVVSRGMSISGLFELEPLVSTSLNGNLRLDAAEARRLSPLFWPPPAGKTMIAYVGGAESSEFLRQSRSAAARWGAAGVHTRCVEPPGESHFTVIAGLSDPESAITRDLAALAAP